MSAHASEIDLPQRDWRKLLPLIDASLKDNETTQAIFQVFSTGLDITKFDSKRDVQTIIEQDKLLPVVLRPFGKLNFCSETSSLFISDRSNTYLVISYPDNTNSFCCVGTNTLCDTHFFNNTLCIPLYYYTNENEPNCNVSDSAWQLFNNYYGHNDPSSPVCYAGSTELRVEFRLNIPAANPVTKEAIFHYVYAVLHYPAYRKEYNEKWKGEIPHIPLYSNFHQWATWGKRLLNLHLHYETAPPYPLLIRELVLNSSTVANLASVPNFFLRANKEKSEIIIDASTTLYNIPHSAWNYKLGHQSALEWVLDNYKAYETGFLSATGQYNTVPYTANKDQIIDLLKRICTVSIETMKIIEHMPNEPIYLNY